MAATGTRIVAPFQRISDLQDEKLQRLQSNVGNALDPIIALLANRDNATLLTGEYTAADVLAKLLTVDGAGSGLDADLLDGLDSTAFSLLSHVHSAADITTGTLAVVRGGTGASTLGTSKAIQSGSGGALEASAVTTAELGFVTGVTSAIQTQLAARELTANKGANNGYAPLDGSADVPDANLPSGIQRTSEKGNANGYASLDGDALVPGNEGGVPTGMVLASGLPDTATVSGYEYCDGRALSRTTFADLFAAIGITHGQGDGSTTFNIPDYEGRFLRGVDNGASRDPDAAGRTAMATGGNTGDDVGSVQADATALPNTTFSLAINRSVGGGGVSGLTGTGRGSTNTSSTGGQVTGGGDNETRPLNAYVTYWIKT